MKIDGTKTLFLLVVKCIVIITMSYGVFSYISNVVSQQNTVHSFMIVPTYICLMFGVLQVSVTLVDTLFVWGKAFLFFIIKSKGGGKPFN